MILVCGAAAVLAGGFVQGCIGFGLGMVTLVPLLFLMDQRTAVPVLMMLSMLNTAPIAWSNRDKIRFGIVAPLIGGAVFGIPLGLAANTSLDAAEFRTLVGIVLVGFAGLLASGRRFALPRPRLASFPIGFLSGIMNGSMSMGGPPVVLFFSNQEVPKAAFRANTVTYFSCMNVVSISLATNQGLIGSEVLIRAAFFAPFLVAGTYAGSVVSRRVSENLFRRLTLTCVGGMGLIMAVRSVLAM